MKGSRTQTYLLHLTRAYFKDIFQLLYKSCVFNHISRDRSLFMSLLNIKQQIEDFFKNVQNDKIFKTTRNVTLNSTFHIFCVLYLM